MLLLGGTFSFYRAFDRTNTCVVQDESTIFSVCFPGRLRHIFKWKYFLCYTSVLKATKLQPHGVFKSFWGESRERKSFLMRQNTESPVLIEMEIGLDVCRPTSLFLFFKQSRGEERASGAGEGGREGGRITTVFPEVINKRISSVILSESLLAFGNCIHVCFDWRGL